MHQKNRKKFSKHVGGREKKTKLGYLPEDTLSYYRRVSEALIEGFENEEDKNIFLNNSFDQLIQESLTVAQNQTASRIIELLISEASASNLRRLFVSMCSDLSVAFLDRFASHVFQALIQLLPKFILPQSELKTEGKAVENEEDVDQGIIEESFKSVCSFVEKTFEVLFCHTYGSHVIRALMEVLGGAQVSHELSKGHGSHEDRHDRAKTGVAPEGCNVSLPSEFRALFDQFTEKVFRLCDNEVYLKDPSASPLVQTVLLILNKIDPVQCHLHCKTIMQQVALTCVETKNPAEVIPDLAQSQVGSHLLEVIFKLSPALEEIFSSLLKGRLLQYAIHPVANYVLQRFIYSLKDRDLMKKVYLELSKYVEDILAVGHLGLITCLADSCRRLHVCQDEFVTVLMEAFHCKEPEERNIYLTRLILSFVTYEVFFKVDSATEKSAEKSEEKLLSPLNMHGSLLLQQLLQFDKPKIIALGVAAMKPAELNIMCCDPSGSHAVDVFFSSPTILDKTKEMFLKKMKGLFVETGCSKNGSRCLENIWKNLDVKQRKRLAEELSENEDRLRRDRFGHFLYRNLGLNQFVKRRNDWLEHQGVLSKRRRMLTQLLHGKAAPEKKEDSSFPLESDGEEDKVTAIFNKLAHAKQAFERVTSNSKQDTNDSEFNSLATAKKRKGIHTDEQSPRKKNKQTDQNETETNESNLEAHPKKPVKKKEKQTYQNETKTNEDRLVTHPDKPVKKKKKQADKNETKTNESNLATHTKKPLKKKQTDQNETKTNESNLATHTEKPLKKKQTDQNETKTNESNLVTHPKKPGIMKKKGKKVTNEKCETPETENVEVTSEAGTQFVYKKSKKNKIKGQHFQGSW